MSVVLPDYVTLLRLRRFGRVSRLCYTFADAPLSTFQVLQLRTPSQLTPAVESRCAPLHTCALASETNAITNADVPCGTVYTSAIMLHFCVCAAWPHSVTSSELPRFVRVGRLCYTFAIAPLELILLHRGDCAALRLL
jgi:hypothetical protein